MMRKVCVLMWSMGSFIESFVEQPRNGISLLQHFIFLSNKFATIFSRINFKKSEISCRPIQGGVEIPLALNATETGKSSVLIGR